jgi:nicotinate-nucleotide adenylyltransferase
VQRKLDEVLTPEFASRFSYDEELRGFRGPTGRMICFREVTFLDIASSDIRKRLQEGKDIRYLVTEEIRRYIEDNGLYRNDDPHSLRDRQWDPLSAHREH